MYENLLLLPYFQGMSRDDITAILDKITFEFKKYSAGDTIFQNGDKCNHFAILTKGKANCTRQAPDGTYSITEEIEAPFAIEPYSMFGYNTTYKRKYSASDDCTILIIDKHYLFSDFTKHNIFNINFLNLISRKAQKVSNDIWEFTPTSIEGRIAHFIAMRCESARGIKRISIKMERLATILCETRLNVSKALNALKGKGYIELHRGEIVVHALEKLTASIKQQQAVPLK